MVTVTYNKMRYELCVQGHAGSVKRGPDPVCAACSALTLGLEAALTGRGINAHISIERGSARFLCRPTAGREREVSLILDAYAEGFAALAAGVPEYVRYECGA